MNASRQSLIVSVLLCALLAALFVARWRLAPYALEAPCEGGMPLAAALTRFTVAHGWWAAACAAVVVGWTLLLVVQLSVKYAPASSRNYLPPQIFLVVAGGVAIAGEALAALLAAWFLVLSVRQFVFSFHKGYSFTELFHAGFWLGLVPLLYAPAAVWVVPVAVSALIVFRRLFREGVVCLAGVALPLPAAGFVHWAMGGEAGYIWQEVWRCTVEQPDVAFSLPFTTIAVALPVAALVASALVRAAGMRNNIRKTPWKFVAFTALVLLWMAGSAALPGTSTTLAALWGVPCSVILPYAFAGHGAGASTAIYSLILAAVLALHLLPVLGIPVP
ncbi:MAG: hypothetical protein LBU98_00610 [Alistipes sp.]|jgi:hypothetical protein|nr:hypothetical protein [Alistipes sp.]